MANQTLSYFVNFIINSRKLDPKEEDILVKRLRKKNLREIGKKYKLTYERIRQIESQALKKLKSKISQGKLF